MDAIPFRLPLPRTVAATVAQEPVYNALNSLALLNDVDRLPAVSAWVKQTAAGLSPRQARVNQLIFEALPDAVNPDRVEDFGAFLASLAAQPPRHFRDQVLVRFCCRVPPAPPLDEPPAAPAPEQLLVDRQAYLAWTRRLSPGIPLDETLHAEAHALLGDPAVLHDLVVSHLRTLWGSALAAEWSRSFTAPSRAVSGLQHRLKTESAVADNFRLFAERELGAYPALDASGVDQIIFVPTPHPGRHVVPRLDGATLRIFFDASRNFATLARTSPIEKPELVLRLAALADETRLRILAMFADRDELSAQEIMAELDLSQSSVSRQLKQLFAYLVENRAGGANKLYRLSPAQIDLTFDALKQIPAGERRPADADQRADQPGDLRRFMDRQARITMFPVRPRDKLLILEYLAARFEPGRSYTEREVNAIIDQHITFGDFATLRRELYNNHFLNRETDGSRYWREAPAGPEV